MPQPRFGPGPSQPPFWDMGPGAIDVAALDSVRHTGRPYGMAVRQRKSWKASHWQWIRYLLPLEFGVLGSGSGVAQHSHNKPLKDLFRSWRKVQHGRNNKQIGGGRESDMVFLGPSVSLRKTRGIDEKEKAEGLLVFGRGRRFHYIQQTLGLRCKVGYICNKEYGARSTGFHILRAID